MIRSLFAFVRDVIAYRPDADACTLMAVADAVGVTETTPLYDQLRRERVADAADTRLDLYGDCDFDEWSREVAQP